MTLYQKKYRKASNKILSHCNLRINDSTEEEQNSKSSIQDKICQTIEVVNQHHLTYLAHSEEKKLKELENNLKEINNNVNYSLFTTEL